jgi:hypothetical protein
MGHDAARKSCFLQIDVAPCHRVSKLQAILQSVQEIRNQQDGYRYKSTEIMGLELDLDETLAVN